MSIESDETDASVWPPAGATGTAFIVRLPIILPEQPGADENPAPDSAAERKNERPVNVYAEVPGFRPGPRDSAADAGPSPLSFYFVFNCIQAREVSIHEYTF